MVVRSRAVVPQTLWIPHNATDRRNHVEEAPLQMPIFFQHTDGNLGLPLDVAISGRCDSLLNAQHFAPLGPHTTTYIRILVSDIFSAVVNFAFRIRYNLLVARLCRVQAPGSNQGRNASTEYRHSLEVCPAPRSIGGCIYEGQASSTLTRKTLH